MDPAAELEENALAAWQVLGRGLAEAGDREIEPDDRAALAALEERSTVLLLRLLTVFVAESRGLTDGEADARSASERIVPLEELRADVCDEIEAADGGVAAAYDERSTAIWRRLEALFRLYDEGSTSLGVPPYEGDLFDPTAHDDSSGDAIGDRSLAAAVSRLSTVETEDGRTLPIDFADVETHRLGSVYETLLEHRFRIAPEAYAAVATDGGLVWKPSTAVDAADARETVAEGELYAVTDDGERKATGTYYTPEDVVDYVVEETVGPLVEEIADDLESRGLDPGTREYLTAFHRRVTALRILDPAMGSGRFLERTLAFLVSRVLAAAGEVEGATALEEPRVRRDVAASCLYGVDRDETAVELATVSLWLETLAADRPADSLDRHLRVGNALVGSDPADHAAETASEGEADCTDPSARRRAELANVRTASRFDLAVPDDALERLSSAIDDDDAWAAFRSEDWFRAAQAMSDERGFFHWDLEFPEVFRDERGRRADAGFDAVLGNPPWVATAGRADISATMDRPLRAYLEERYATTRQQFDLYVAFCERFVRLAADGRIGIVVPDAILAREQNVHVRRYLLERTNLATVLHLGTAFEGVENGAAIVVTGADEEPVNCAALEGEASIEAVDYAEIPQSVFRDQDACRFGVHLDQGTRSILAKVDRHSRLGDRVDVSRGEEISKRADVLAESDGPGLDPIVPGAAVNPYGFDDAETRYVPRSEIEKDRANYRCPKLVLRQTASTPIGALDTAGRITIKSAYNVGAGEPAAKLRRLLGVLNSSLLAYYHEVKHAAYRAVFPQINQSTVESYPIAVPDAPEFDDLVAERIELTRQRRELTLDLRAQLGQYREGDPLSEIGTCQPVAPRDSPLRATGDELSGLRLGRASVDRRSPESLRIDATARYKPATDGDCETDRWGYAETEPVPALRLSALTEPEADLIEAFVPVAVDEGGGFANVRERATKTISLLDRLRALTIPVVDDVRAGLERYRETTARAEALEARIADLDRRIDDLVYDRYGVTAAEIETIEAVVGEG